MSNNNVKVQKSGWTIRGIPIATIALAACVRLSFNSDKATKPFDNKVIGPSNYTVPVAQNTNQTLPEPAPEPNLNYTVPVAQNTNQTLPEPAPEHNLTCSNATECQVVLMVKGYDIGPSGPDGIVGPATLSAANKCIADGRCDLSFVIAITYSTPIIVPVYDEPVSTVGSSSVFSTFNPSAGTFIPYAGNGRGPTLLADGTWSHSAGRGTGSHHGGIIH